MRDSVFVLVPALVIAAMIESAATEVVPPERAARHRQAAALGDYAGRPLPPPLPPPPPALTFPVLEDPPPPPLTRSELVTLARAEYERAGVPLWLISWLLAQIEAESAWDCDAESPVGARGCPQAMPPTWAEEAPRTDPSCAGVEPTDPECGLRFQPSYMARVAGWVGDPGDWHLAAAGYNAGAGNIQKEQRACARALGCDPNVWFGNVEAHCLRPAWHCQETSAYLRRIQAGAARYEVES